MGPPVRQRGLEELRFETAREVTLVMEAEALGNVGILCPVVWCAATPDALPGTVLASSLLSA